MKKYNILIVGLSKHGAFQLLQQIPAGKYSFSLLDQKDLLPDRLESFKKSISIKNHYRNIPETIKEVNRLQKPLDGIVCLFEKTTLLAAIVAQKLNKIGISPSDSLTVRNKFLLRERLTQYKLYNHFYALINSKRDIDKLDDSVFPLIAKPITAYTSILVRKIESKSQLYDYFKEFQKKNPNQIPDKLARKYLSLKYKYVDFEKSFVVEKYLTGSEVSIEGIVANGEIYFAGVTDKIISDPPYFIELGHIFPSQKPKKLQEKILSFTQKCLQATTIDNTGFHVEMKIKDGKFDIVEIGGRLGGGFIQNLIYYTKGYNTVWGLVDASLGRFKGFKRVNKDVDKIACTYYIVAEKEGVLKSIESKKFEKKYKKNIKFKIIDRAIEEKIVLPPKDYTSLRLGKFIFTANSMSEISKIIVDFKKMVKVTIV